MANVKPNNSPSEIALRSRIIFAPFFLTKFGDEAELCAGLWFVRVTLLQVIKKSLNYLDTVVSHARIA